MATVGEGQGGEGMKCKRTVMKSLQAGWTFAQAMFPCDCERTDMTCDGRYGKCQFQEKPGRGKRR